jgi:hypothetical protein
MIRFSPGLVCRDLLCGTAAACSVLYGQSVSNLDVGIVRQTLESVVQTFKSLRRCQYVTRVDWDEICSHCREILRFLLKAFAVYPSSD